MKAEIASMKWRLLLWSLFFGALVMDIHRKGGGLKVDHSVQSLFFVFTSWLVVLASFVLVEICTPIKARRWVLALSSFVFGIACYFSKRTAFPFSYSIGINNYDWLLSWDGLVLIGKITHSTFFASDFFWSMVLAISIFFTYRKNRQGFLEIRQKQIAGVACLLVVLTTSYLQSYSYDPVSNFLRSIRHHYAPIQNLVSKKAQGVPELPPIEIQSAFPSSERPNIFLVIVESFNGRFVNQKTQEGLEYTPFFNRLTESNLYFPNYFSNSVQTSKGHFAALCGQVPMLRSIEFKNSECFTKRCLATILTNHGYDTSFIQADPNFGSEGIRDFVLTRGFQEMPELVRSCKEEKDRCYGIGIRDDVFYERALTYLEKEHDPGTPKFAVLASVASHMPFSFQPSEEREIHRNPANLKEHYLNMLRMVDSSLESMVTRFSKSPLAKNSILIITGDHGFPTGEHGSYHNENYAYSENFDVPLLVMDFRQDLKKKYSHLQDKAFSHLNLGPTILDLAGIDGMTDFVAPSIFVENAEKNPIYLVQPYSGGYQVAVEWPFYYIFEEHKGREYLYNMVKDPGQMRPLAIGRYRDFVGQMRLKAAQIYRQQQVFDCRQPALENSFTANNGGE